MSLMLQVVSDSSARKVAFDSLGYDDIRLFPHAHEVLILPDERWQGCLQAILGHDQTCANCTGPTSARPVLFKRWKFTIKEQTLLDFCHVDEELELSNKEFALF